MKKFMTNIKTLAALLMAGAAFSACSSSDDNIANEQPETPTQPQVYTMVIKASKGGDASTRALSLDGTTLNACWSGTETIEVLQSNVKIGTAKAAPSPNGNTTITATLKSAPDSNNDLIFYLCGSNWVYTGQVGLLTGTGGNSISEKYDYVTAVLYGYSYEVIGSDVTPKNSYTVLNFDDGITNQAIIKFTLKDKANDAAISPSTLTVSDGTSTVELTDIPEATYTANGAGVLYVAFPATGSEKIINLTATVGSDTYTYTTSSAKTFTNGQYYEITVKMTKQTPAIPEGAINGKFSVSYTKQVYFSKGNLRYASGTWSFFDHQYDYYTSYSADAWDKFGWSTSATTYGMNTSGDNSDYSGDFVDWGATMGSGWCTLSKDEWLYLFNMRSGSTVNGTENGRYAKAKVNNVQGIILFPDTYTHPDGVADPVGVNDAEDDTGWNDYNYSLADWTKMESAGCVFLPAAGYRAGTGVNYAGSDGYYWSSSPDYDDTDYARDVWFDSDDLNVEGSDSRYFGHSVRLVRPVQ